MARPIADVLREVSNGTLFDDATAALAEVVAAVTETRKAGTLTITLSVKPNSDTSVKVSGDLKTKVPELARGESVFFVRNGQDLVRHDPRQDDMFRPREIEDAGDQPARKVKGYDD